MMACAMRAVCSLSHPRAPKFGLLPPKTCHFVCRIHANESKRQAWWTCLRHHLTSRTRECEIFEWWDEQKKGNASWQGAGGLGQEQATCCRCRRTRKRAHMQAAQQALCDPERAARRHPAARFQGTCDAPVASTLMYKKKPSNPYI